MRAPRQRAGQGGKAPTLTDAEVLQLRALREFKGWPLSRLCDRFPHAEQRTIQALVDYTNRGKLIPTLADVPTDA